jgi:hypothetical protein
MAQVLYLVYTFYDMDTLKPGVQLKIQKRRQQGRGATGREYKECPNCRQYYLRGMYVLDRDRRRQGTAQGKWVKIGLYCEGCGQSWTYRQKEIFQENGIEYEI